MSSTKEILKKAQSEGYAIGAFNGANISTLKAIVQAAKKLSSPVIIEASSGEIGFIGARTLSNIIEGYRKEYQIPIILNLDHSHTFKAAKEGIEAGFDYIHIDGSKRSFTDNVNLSKKVVKLAHSKRILVEGEIDRIVGTSSDRRDEKVEDIQQLGEYTNPKKAVEYVGKTGVDTLAVFVGNVHGVYSKPPKLDFKILEEIRKKLRCYISLHGGSGIKSTDIKKAIKVGKIVKVNVNSELRIAFREALEESLDHTEEVAVYKIMPPAIEAVQKVVEDKIKLFGSEGKA